VAGGVGLIVQVQGIKEGFVVLGGDSLLGFLGSLGSFQPSLRVNH
jgi:hypothetical protein